MTDAHCHISAGDEHVRELLIGRDFDGIHPWDAASAEVDARLAALRERLKSNPALGVGEIGLDRLKVREIPTRMREVFARQLELAAEFRRPVVLHGAKCWGEVVRCVQPFAKEIPAFLFHGFSRSEGLFPDIFALNGFISVGPAILNDHAVNYRALVKRIPSERLLVETDRTDANRDVSLADVLRVLAQVRGDTLDHLERITDANAIELETKF